MSAQAPQYILEPDPQSQDHSTCIIRFVVRLRAAPATAVASRVVGCADCICAQELPLLLLLTLLFAIVGGGAVVTLSITSLFSLHACCPVKAPRLPSQQLTRLAGLLVSSQAGPPYEDIAFRIVNKEWNYARKHGFRCSFERGILHLFFNFKRARYRR